MRIFSLLLFLACSTANATSVGYLDAKANKFIIRTKFFFYGPAASEEEALSTVEEMSRKWNEPKINYFHNGIPYRVEFQFKYAVDDGYSYFKQIIQPNPITSLMSLSNLNSRSAKLIEHFAPAHFSPLYPLSFDGKINYRALVKDPELNIIEMVNFSPKNEISTMVCGGGTGTFVVQNLSPKGTTFAHEFGHALGLPHSFKNDCISETPSIMCPRGSTTLPKYQYIKNKKPWEKGGTINPIYRVVRAEDILNLNISGIKPNAHGERMIGPHMKQVCLDDHSSFNDPIKK